MKVGRFSEALANSQTVIGMLDELKGAFDEDYAIVASKFLMQQANLAFVAGKA